MPDTLIPAVTPPEMPGGSTTGSLKNPLNQSDSASEGAFPAALAEVVEVAGDSGQGPLAGQAAGAGPLPGLQEPAVDGKVLPLAELEAAVDGADVPYDPDLLRLPDELPTHPVEAAPHAGPAGPLPGEQVEQPAAVVLPPPTGGEVAVRHAEAPVDRPAQGGRAIDRLLRRFDGQGGAGPIAPADGGDEGDGGLRVREPDPLLTPESRTLAGRRVDVDAAAAVSVLRRLVAGTQQPAAEPASRAEGIVSAAAASTTSNVTSVGSGLSSLSLDTPFQQQPDWQQSLGERIQWMVGQRLQGAQIKMNPAHLGPVEVRIQVQNEQASIQFLAAHGVVRDALEAAVPRLRDMLDANGLDLVDVDVAGQSFAEQQRETGEGPGSVWRGFYASDDGHEPEAEPGGVRTLTTSLLAAGRLDLFV